MNEKIEPLTFEESEEKQEFETPVSNAKKMILQIPAYITKFESMAHGVLKLIIHTQEDVDKESTFKLMKMKDQLGWLSFVQREVDKQQYEIEPEDLIDLPPLNETQFDTKKSTSQRLRDVLFVQYIKKGGKKEDFELWRVRKMERIISAEKDKIPQD